MTQLTPIDSDSSIKDLLGYPRPLSRPIKESYKINIMKAANNKRMATKIK